MRKNKGFTLIELLAVLIILAIIALITTPIILNVIETSRQKGAEDKSWGVIDAIKIAFYTDQASNDPQYAVGTDITFGTNPVLGTTPVRASGQMPSSGKGRMDANGVITVTDLVFDQYHCSTNSTATVMLCKRNSAPTAAELAAGKLS